MSKDTPALRALKALDLTNLDEACTDEDIDALIARAQTKYGNVAAVCIWPQFVSKAKRQLAGTGIRVATVVNFPSGMDDSNLVREMTEKAVEDGADEIDMVIPYPLLIEGDIGPVAATVARVRRAAGNARVKAILETGMLPDPDTIRLAAREAIGGGADFIKTSTGKVPMNATPEAARIMLEEIKESGKKCGLKPSGGVKTVADAETYLGLCDEIMGDGWADDPAHFRIGASGVLSALLADLEGQDVPEAGEGY
ncbi:deoxyribose-phosphate aldolase [Paracoccaceae bacterium GXU_MW_L88]